jgi:BirA family transcriptional regulator, biotin operon repressor / biotin---[acetyl-CoA-carboxylase] ligase
LSSYAEAGGAAKYDGVSAADLEAQLDLPRVLIFAEVPSTMDVAHEAAAAGAPAGTLVVADAQTAGRGRLGRSWTAHSSAGVWFTLIERPASAQNLEALPLRVGLELAPALDEFAGESVRLKWPNDLYLGTGKLAGVLSEARWRGGGTVPEWIAVGVGINLRAPASEGSAAELRAGARRLDVLASAVRAVRCAASRLGALSDAERACFAERDLAAGHRCTEPVAGVVAGIDAAGGLLVDVDGEVAVFRSGSLVLQPESVS